MCYRRLAGSSIQFEIVEITAEVHFPGMSAIRPGGFFKFAHCILLTVALWMGCSAPAGKIKSHKEPAYSGVLGKSIVIAVDRKVAMFGWSSSRFAPSQFRARNDAGLESFGLDPDLTRKLGDELVKLLGIRSVTCGLVQMSAEKEELGEVLPRQLSAHGARHALLVLVEPHSLSSGTGYKTEYSVSLEVLDCDLQTNRAQSVFMVRLTLTNDSFLKQKPAAIAEQLIAELEKNSLLAKAN